MKIETYLICTLLLALVSSGCSTTEALRTSMETREEWNADVLRLFSLKSRDEALQKLLKEARYPRNPTYKEDSVGQIKEVVVCPQANNKPLVTVFARSKSDPEDVSPRSGHMIVIRNDGMIIPFYYGSNYLDGYFCDLNGDGMIDYIDSWKIDYEGGTVTSLHVVSIREEFTPSLVVYWKEDMFTWRLHQPDLSRIPTIQIGKQKGEKFKLVAEYQWLSVKNRWAGPKGSPGMGFLMVEGNAEETAKKLLTLKADQDRNGHH